jgi:hypothetical protein
LPNRKKKSLRVRRAARSLSGPIVRRCAWVWWSALSDLGEGTFYALIYLSPTNEEAVQSLSDHKKAKPKKKGEKDMGVCYSGPKVTPEDRTKSKEIDQQIRKDKRAWEHEVKLLLLGSSIFILQEEFEVRKKARLPLWMACRLSVTQLPNPLSVNVGTF